MNMRRHCMPDDRSGVTILELTVAVVLMSVLFSLVYTCWKMINKYTLVQGRRTELRAECGRLAETVAAEVRRAQAVIRWDRTSIVFIPSDAADTVTYAFFGSMLERNARPVTMLLPLTEFADFAIENLNDEDPASPFLFRFTITLVNAHNESATVSQTVMAHRLTGQLPDNDFMW